MQNFFYVKDERGVRGLSYDEAWEENQKGADFFWTPQEFSGIGKRKIEDLVAIHYVCGDFDNISKSELASRLRSVPPPTMIVKTRSGFHVYWHISPSVRVEDPQKMADEYRTFVEEALIPIGADKNAKDVSRLLRYPGSLYWRDSKGNQYTGQDCPLVLDESVSYTWARMMKLFPRIRTRMVQVERSLSPRPNIATRTQNDDKSFWEAVFAIPAMDGLKRLSGSRWVNGETYSFKRDAAGIRIYVNGKQANAWIDREGKIGSTQYAGPGIWQWLGYFGHDKATCAKIMKEVFPDELGL